MTNVIKRDFGFRDPNGYDQDDRFNVGAVGLIMTMDWMLKVYRDAALESFHELGDHEMAKVFPVLEITQAIYRGLVLPFCVTKGVAIRRDRTKKRYYSVLALHYPIDAIKEVEALATQGKEPLTEFQIEVTYADYEDGDSEETMFGVSTTSEPDIPDDITLKRSVYETLINNINTIVTNHGGFSKAITAGDVNESPLLIGFIPFSGANYIRIALVITRKSKI